MIVNTSEVFTYPPQHVGFQMKFVPPQKNKSILNPGG